MIANLLISLIAGAAAFVCLLALGVPAPVVLALLIAVTDLIPLVGATIGSDDYILVHNVGALLAVPVSGALQVIVIAVRRQRPLEQLVLPESYLEPNE